MITMAAYSGNLRAMLLRPNLTPPIETIEDIVTSGLPWKMIDYGEEYEQKLASSEDQLIRKFWKNREVIQYDSTYGFPLKAVCDIFYSVVSFKLH